MKNARTKKKSHLYLWLLISAAITLLTEMSVAEPSEMRNSALGNEETAEQVIQQLNNVKTIDITDRVDDSSIAARISKILATSEWFDSLNVTVAEGIVILEGQTSKKEYRQWAETIAARTQGVVAVINKLTLVSGNDGNLSPVIDEGRDIVNKSIAALPTIISSLVVLIFSILLAKYISSFSFRVLNKRIESTMLRRLIARVLAIPVVIIGIYIVLNITGLGTLAATVIGGTGLLGLVIGFAFRDIAENFLASVLISIQRPFRLGETIKVLDYLGVVQAVTTRGTIIMTLEGNHVQIPNAIIFKQPIVNLTANPNVRLDFTVGIGYDSSISEAQAAALTILEEHPAVLNDPEAWVLAEELSPSTVILRIYFWVNSKEHNVLKVKSAIIRIVKSTFMSEGISMPDDAREIIFPQGIEVTTFAAARDKAPRVTSPSAEAENRAGLVKDVDAEHSKRKSNSSANQIVDHKNIINHTIGSNAEAAGKSELVETTGEKSICTKAEGHLVSDVPMIKAQANSVALGGESNNLLKK